MKNLLVILLCCHLLNVVIARYTNLMPSRLKRETEDRNDDMQTENDDLSRLPDLGTLAKPSDLDEKQSIQNDLLVLPPLMKPPDPDENKKLPLIDPTDKDEIEDKLSDMLPEENLPVPSDIVIETKMPDIVAEDRLPGFVPPEEVPLGIVVKEPMIVPLTSILPPPVPVLKPVPMIVPVAEPLPPPDVPVAEPVPPGPFLVKIPLLKDVDVREPLILPVKPIPPPLVIPEVEPPLPPVVPIEEPVPLPAPVDLEEGPPIPVPIIPEVEPPPPPVVPVIVEPVPPPPPVLEVVPLPPPPLKIPFLEEVVFKPPDFTSPFAKGTRWALYFSNMFLNAFTQVLASAQVTIAKFAQLAAP